VKPCACYKYLLSLRNKKIFCLIYSGNNTLRVQLDGRPLPSARLVGVKLFYMRDIRNYDHENNELLVPWGQFLTHDISFYPDDIRNATTPGSNSFTKIITKLFMVCRDITR